MKTIIQKWPITVLVALGMADPQIPIPFPMSFPGMAPAQPPQQVAVPIGIPIPVAVAIPAKEKETTTTTTTSTCTPVEEDSDSTNVKIVIPWPPFNWIREAPKVLPFTNNNFTLKLPPQLPLPPPGMPIPIGIPPPPIVMVPLPPIYKHPHDSSKYNRPKYDASRQSRQSSSDTSGSTSQSSSSQTDTDTDSSRDKRKKRKKKRKKYGIYRNGRRILSNKIENQINPVLSFVSQTGEVKLQKRLTSRDALLLLNTARDTLKTIQVPPDKVPIEQNRAFVLTFASPKTENTENVEKTGRLVSNVLSSGRKTLLIHSPYHNLEKKGTILEPGLNSGSKTLVLHPPHDKTVSNISVIFNVAP